MTNIENAQIKDILPYSNPRVRALSFALNKMIVKLKLKSDTSRVRAMIDTLQEEGVDLLAKELNTPFYDTTFDIDKKRTLVKNTPIYYMLMGTRDGIGLLLKDAFGGGEIYKEWFEYGGNPHHFFVSVASQMYSEEARQQFLKKLKQFSRLSAVCDGIIAATELPNNITKIYSYLSMYKQVEVKNYV